MFIKKTKEKSYLIEGYMNIEWFFFKRGTFIIRTSNDNIPEYIFGKI